MTSSLILVSYQHAGLQIKVSWRGVRWMTSYHILVSYHAVPCPAARSLWKRSYASMWMTSSLILASHQHPVLQLQVSWRGVENPCEWPRLVSWWYWCCWGDISELSFSMSAVPRFSLPYLFAFPHPSPEYDNNSLRHHLLYLTRFYAMFNSKRKDFLVSDTT